jgi:hypothetical protein
LNKKHLKQRAYLAGFVDGEGCITIVRSAGQARCKIGYSIRVDVGQKDGKLMDLLYGLYNGHVCQELKDGKFAHYRWTVYGKSAYKILHDIEPFLIIKREQARLAMEFFDRSLKRREDSGRYSLTPEVIERNDSDWSKIRKLHKIYSQSHAAAETKFFSAPKSEAIVHP